MHLTRRQDLLDLDLPPADLTLYDFKPIAPTHEHNLPAPLNTWTTSNCLSSKRNYAELAQQAAQQQWTHVEYLARLIDGEYQQRRQHAIERRVKAARFPVLKTLEQFHWNWPKKINRLQVQNLFRLEFLDAERQRHLPGQRGLGQNPPGHRPGLRRLPGRPLGPLHQRHQVINQLDRRPETRPPQKRTQKLPPARELLVLDELGYLPIDQHGADLLFQVISQRYERGSIVLTTNKPFKHWASIFNNDSTLTSAVLDRLLHHAETVVIEGNSFRMKDQIET